MLSLTTRHQSKDATALRQKTQGQITESFEGLGTFDSTTVLEDLGKDD